MKVFAFFVPVVLLLFFYGHFYVAEGDSDAVFEERDGVVAVEAESYYAQTKYDLRKWYRVDNTGVPELQDPDEAHFSSASNGVYLECLPDTRTTHDDKLIRGTNFSNQAGEMAVLHYKVHINNPGRYYVWVRAYSTGTEDNGIHVGLNGEWPESGQRLQWCEGKNEWTWDSKQRTAEAHCGVPELIYLDIEETGVHEIHFSMREDGFEFDKFVLSKNYLRPSGKGPNEVLKEIDENK